MRLAQITAHYYCNQSESVSSMVCAWLIECSLDNPSDDFQRLAIDTVEILYRLVHCVI